MNAVDHQSGPPNVLECIEMVSFVERFTSDAVRLQQAIQI